MSAKIKRIKKRKYRIVRLRSSRALLTLLAFLLVILSSIFLLRSSFFRISEIEVIGADEDKRAEILRASGVKTDESIFGFNAKTAKAAIENIFEIKQATVTRVLPDKVRIEIVERKALFILSALGRCCGVEEDGTVLSTADSLSGMDGILVSGISVQEENLAVGNKLDFSANARLSVVRSVAEHLERTGLSGDVSEIYAAESGYFYIYTTNSSVVKFYSFSAFEANEDFIARFIKNEQRHIMAEVIEDVNPVYKRIEIV